MDHMQSDAPVLGKLEKASSVLVSAYLAGSHFHVLLYYNNNVFRRLYMGIVIRIVENS